MRIYIKMSSDEFESSPDLNADIRDLCDKIEQCDELLYCIPKVGYLMELIQLLSKSDVTYELEIINREI